ncbi:phage tail tape measure protein [Vreelandella titanicae]|nr:phage tail tape measure protein [Halomonas titanicae]
MTRAERSTKRFEEQTKRQNKELERVVSKIDPVVGKLKELERQQQVLNRAQKSGAIDQKQYELLTRKLEKQRATVRGLGSDYDRATKSANGLAGSLNAVRTVALIASAALGGMGISKVISETARFGESMNTLRAITGATQEQYEALEKQARTLGATTRYSAQESADAQAYLARAGFDVNQTLAATPSILALATAGQLDLATAADIASNVLGQFSLQIGDLGRVNDVLAKAANSSNTTVTQLAQAFKKAGPIANSANISLEQTAAMLSALADNGFQGEIGGTGVLGFIRQLSNVTPNAAAALKKYGLSVKDISLESNSLSTVLHRLKDAQFSVSDSFKIFASEAAPAALKLLENADKIDELSEAYENAGGTASAMAKIIGQGLANSIKTFNSVIGESTLQMGQGGLGQSFEFLINQASGIISVWNGMGDVYAESNELTSEQARRNEILAQAIQTTAAALAAVTASYVAYTVAVTAAGTATKVFATLAKANPILLAISGVAAAIAILYSFKDQLISVGTTTAEMGEYASEIWRVLVSRISVYWNSLNDTLNDVLDKFDINVSDVLETTKGYWNSYVSYLATVTATAINTVIGLFVSVSDAVWTTVNTIYDNYVYMFNRILSTGTAFKDDFKNIINGNFDFDNLAKEMEEGFSGTTNVFEAVGQSIATNMGRDYVGEVLDGVKSVIDEAADNIAARNLYKPLSEWMFDFNDAANTTIPTVEEFSNTLDDSSESSKENAKAQRDAEKAALKFENSIRSLTDRLDPLGKKFRDFNSDEMLLQTAMLSNKISIEKYFDLLAKLKKEQEEAVKGTDAPTLSISAEFGGVSSDVSNIIKYEEDLEKWRTDELTAIEDLNDAKLLSEQDYFERKAALEKQYAERTNDVAIASKNAQLSVMGNLADSTAGILSTLGQESSAAYKAMFLISKAASMAQAIVNTEQAATLALAQGGGIAGIPMSTIVRASGYASVAAIGATSIMGMAHDGIDSVPREGTWLLDKGERVTTANTSKKLDKTLDNIQNNNTNNSSIVFAPQITVGAGSTVTHAELQAVMKNEHARFKSMLIQEKLAGGILAN